MWAKISCTTVEKLLSLVLFATLCSSFNPSQVKLKNKSFDGGFFKIDVISSNADFRGDYPAVVEVSGRSESTIDIAQLIVPDVAEGTVIKVTVRATR